MICLGSDNNHRTRYRRRPRTRRSFTLVELLVVTVILAVLSSTVLFALHGTMEQAKVVRTRAQIAKINELIMEQWESYRTRKIPILLPQNMDARTRAQIRLRAIREIMRMEMPERITDITWTPAPFTVAGTRFEVQPPALWRSYRRRAGLGRALPPSSAWPTEAPTADSLHNSGNWTREFQRAECLYLILSQMQDGERSALDFFKSSEIGDLDGDGMPEILDAWGNPIIFLRWAPGFATMPGPDGAWGVAGVDDDDDGVVDNQYSNDGTSEMGAYGSDDRSEVQLRPYLDPFTGEWVNEAPDPFDPLRVDPRWNGSPAETPFALIPLIASSGPDGLLGLWLDFETGPFVAYGAPPQSGQPNPAFPNDPYHIPRGQYQIGRVTTPAAEDNITNHLLGGQ